MVHSATDEGALSAAANLHRWAIIVERDDLVDVWNFGVAGPGG